MSFPNGLVPTTQRVHPTPLYELAAAVVIAWLLWWAGARQLQSDGQKAWSPPLASGAVFALYLLLTGVARFLVEFIRINPRSLLGMSNAQAASLVSVVAGLFLMFRARKSRAQ